MRRSWWLVSVVTTLKENSVINTKLLSNSIYVHVLVTFFVTFSRSGTYQYCYWMLDCRWPYSPEKFVLDPFQEKEKVLGFTEGAVNAGCVWVVFSSLCCFLVLGPSSGVFLQWEIKRDQFTCSTLVYFHPVTFCSCVKLNFVCVESCFWSAGCL